LANLFELYDNARTCQHQMNVVCFSWIWYSGDRLCGTWWNRWNLTAPARWMGVSDRWAHLAGHATYATGW